MIVMLLEEHCLPLPVMTMAFACTLPAPVTSHHPSICAGAAGHCREFRRLLGVTAEPAASARAAALLGSCFRR